MGAPAGQQPSLARISPAGHRSVLATAAKGEGITGNVRGKDGAVHFGRTRTIRLTEGAS